MAKSDAERQKKTRENKKAAGYVWFGLWIKKAWKPKIKAYIESLKSDEEKK